LTSTPLCDALHILHTENKTCLEDTVQTLDAVRNELYNTTETMRRMTTNVRQNIYAAKKARAAAKEAVEVLVDKANLEMTR
jgi:hypothetical protein